MASRVAVVTGANKGIGLAIVRALCRHFGQNGVVYLTARDEGRGRAAVELLQKEGLDPQFHPLDVTDQSTIDKLLKHLQTKHGGIDVLINNAGIALQEDMHLYENAVRVMETNFFGVLAVCRSLSPLVRSGGRIVNVASWNGYRTFRKELTDDVREKFRQAKSEEDVVKLMNGIVGKFKAKTMTERFSDFTYGLYGSSKLGVIALTKILAEIIKRDTSRDDILINSCCPGLVRTDMTAEVPEENEFGPKISPDEAADTPIFLALLPPGTKELNGQFLTRRKVYDFINTDVIVNLCEPVQ